MKKMEKLIILLKNLKNGQEIVLMLDYIASTLQLLIEFQINLQVLKEKSFLQWPKIKIYMPWIFQDSGWMLVNQKIIYLV